MPDPPGGVTALTQLIDEAADELADRFSAIPGGRVLAVRYCHRLLRHYFEVERIAAATIEGWGKSSGRTE